MRIGFAGTPDPALLVMKRIIESGYEVSVAITKPDMPGKRSGKPLASPVATFADSLNIPVMKPINLADHNFIEELSKLNLDLVIVVAYGKLIPKSLLNIPKYGWINLHFSVLPKYRGAAPLQHAILNGDAATGVTLFKIDENLDTGSILDTASVNIEEKSALEMFPEMADLGASLIVKNLDQGPQNWLMTTQSNSGVSTAAKISTIETMLDWKESGELILRKIRAFSAGPIARCLFNGDVFKIHQAYSTNTLGIAPGEIRIKDKKVFVGTGDKAIELDLVQPSGKRKMPARDWLNGLRLEVANFD